MTAGIETLNILSAPGTYRQLEDRSEELSCGLRDAAKRASVDVCFTRVGSMLCTFFTKGPVTDYRTAKTSDTKAFAAFFSVMLQEGVYLAPSQFEAMFLSLSHDTQDIEKTLAAAHKAFNHIAS
jgi:glutamate-1-semialdehyde 2,1-aminomutase